MITIKIIIGCQQLIRADKKLDTDPKGTQQIEFNRQFKTLDESGNATYVCGYKNMFIFSTQETIKEVILKFCQGRVTALQKQNIMKKQWLNSQTIT